MTSFVCVHARGRRKLLKDIVYLAGLVVANDADYRRSHMLVHQSKRLQSPCFMATNHDASHMPNIHVVTLNRPILFGILVSETIKWIRSTHKVGTCLGNSTEFYAMFRAGDWRSRGNQAMKSEV